MFPLLRDRAPGEPREPFGWEGEVNALEEDHIRIQQLETEMDKLLVRIDEAAEPATRQLLGREFHRSIQRYKAMCLLHFDDEERHFMPRMCALYDDKELVATFEQVMASVGPEERQYVTDHMTQGLNPVELEELWARVKSEG